jgi:hypothetical protein
VRRDKGLRIGRLGPVVAVAIGSNLPLVVESNLKSCKSRLPPDLFDPELITARYFFELSLT